MNKYCRFFATVIVSVFAASSFNALFGMSNQDMYDEVKSAQTMYKLVMESVEKTSLVNSERAQTATHIVGFAKNSAAENKLNSYQELRIYALLTDFLLTKLVYDDELSNRAMLIEEVTDWKTKVTVPNEAQNVVLETLLKYIGDLH